MDLDLHGLQGRWLVGVSGGGDSVAMLRLLVAQGWGERIVVGCFNHLWGEFGDESAAFVVALVGKLGLEVRVGHGSGKAESNAEAVARRERYGWFAQACKDEGLEGVLVAHTEDDVAETFLMRAGKGSGLQGLSGMGYAGEVAGVTVVRPLLGAGREELRDYLRELGQAWLEDPDNEKGGSQRARVRKLRGELEAAGIKIEGLAASVASLAQANAALETLVDGVWKQVTGGWAIERNLLAGLPAEVAVRVMARMMEGIAPGIMVVRRSKRVALWERICAEGEGMATLGGCKFEWDAGRVKVKPE